MLVRVLVVIALVCVSLSFDSYGQSSNLKENPGLKRFNLQSELGQRSSNDIKQVKVGDNVLAKTIALHEQGGEVQYISGGSRSKTVKVIFRQPYQDSQLLQTLSLDFDKDKGFIHSVTLNYKIDSIYLDILPVYEKVVEQAVSKYGEPLTLLQVSEISDQVEGPLRLQRFIDNLKADDAIMGDVQHYLEDKMVTRKTAFEADEQGNALLMTGFKQCYFWPNKAFSEWISLCAFNPGSGNMKGQGIELKLVNFDVTNSIETFNAQEESPDISF